MTRSDFARAAVRKAAFVGSFVVMVAVITLIAPIPAPPAPATPPCAVLEARQMASTTPIAGSFACLEASFAATSQISSDADVAAIAAQPPLYTSYRYLGHTASGYYFQFQGDTVGCFRFHVDTQGLVDHVGFRGAACPQPLP